MVTKSKAVSVTVDYERNLKDGVTAGKYDYVNPPALKRLIAAGALLRPFPQEVLETCYKAANDIYADLSKSNPHFRKMYESLVPFRSESYAWFQVGEVGYDIFMARHSQS